MKQTIDVSLRLEVWFGCSSHSRAIMRYLVDMYAPNHSLYPKDVKRRALIDQFLDYDLGTLYKNISDYFVGALLDHTG